MRDLVQRVILCCASAGLLLLGSITASAATRVALLSGEGDARIAGVVDLAQVRLSNEPELELLDRANVRRVLDEQKLSVSGVVDAGQAIAVGKLLAVDLIAVVESWPGNDTVPGVVIFDSRSGVRYWDAALPVAAAELERAADAIVNAVRTAHRKRDGRAQAFQTVGVMTVRNADLPRSQDSLCETVGLLVERGLSRSPDLAVLERRRLAHVNEERSLPGAAPTKKLLASLTTVDLEVSRAADGRGLKATALLNVAGKEQTENVSVTVPESNAALLSETLLKKLIEVLHAAPVVATADPRLEARRFDGEAAHHYSHQRYVDAVLAADAAWALDPTNEDYGERLSLYLVRYATYLFWPEMLHVIKGGESAWTDARVDAETLETLLTETSRAVEINSGLTRPSAHWVTFNWPLGYLCNRLQGLRRASPPLTRERIDVVLEACRRRSVDYIEAWAAKAEAAPKLLDEYTLHVNDEFGILAAATIDTEHYADLMYPIIDRWLTVTGGWQPQFNSTDGGEGLNMFLNVVMGSANSLWQFDGNAYARKMAPLFAVMRRHARPIIRLYGVAGQLWVDRLQGKVSEETSHQRFADEYRTLAQAIITAPEPWDAARARFSVYEAWPNAIPRGKGAREFYRSELIELCHFMVSRHELNYKIVQTTLSELDHRPALELIRLMLPVIDSPKFRETPNEQTRLRSQLVTAEQEILRKHPEWAAAPVELPWSKATKVFEVSQFRELSELVGQIVVNDVVYGFCLQFEADRSALRLVRVPLTGGEVALLAKLDLELPASGIPRYARPDFVTAACADGEAVYVATNGAGIVVFPLKKGLPRRIGLDDGLPSNKVTSVGVLDGKIYAGVGEGYLISYDLEARRCDVLASSRRKQKLSPFDDRAPFRVPSLVADLSRQRIVFVIGDGLWQFTPADRRMTQVLDLIAVDPGRSGPKLNDASITWTSPLRGRRMLISNVFRVIEIDLEHDRAQVIHSPETGIFPTTPPHLLVNGSLWSGGTFARLSLAKREHQSLPHPDKGLTPFRGDVCLELVDGGRQILAGDLRALWLLQLNEVGLAAGQTSEGLKEFAKQDHKEPARSTEPNGAAPQSAIPLPASSPPKCTVRAQFDRLSAQSEAITLTPAEPTPKLHLRLLP